MTAIFLLQMIGLVYVSLVLAALVILSFSETATARNAEKFLLGTAFGVTFSTVAATLVTISPLN